MIKQYAIVSNANEALYVVQLHEDVIEQAAQIAAYESNAVFVEVPLSNRATLGWHFDGEEYVQTPV